MREVLRKPRGRPFKPGNPGRPPGSRNRVTQMLEQLAEGQAEQIFQKVLKGALAGDGPCQKMLMDRIWPPRKGQTVNVAMPPIKASQDLIPAIASVWEGIREGHLTPEEAGVLSIVIDRSIQAIEHDITKRIEALEKARVARDETKDPTSG